jgi:DNA ligase-1
MKTSVVCRAAAFHCGLALLFVCAGLRPLSSPSTAHADTEKAPVMLAHTWEPHIDIRGWWMSEKLDGVRGYWTGSQMISRSGQAFVTPPWFTRDFPSVPLDGE